MGALNNGGRFILTFHGLGEPGAHVGRDEIPYWVSEETFGEIIDFVASDQARDLPPIEVTFDDGNHSDVSIAYRVLAAKGLSARFFVLAGRIGSSGYLSKRDIRELSEGGMTVGSHGWSHVDWRKATDRELYRELSDAKSALEDIIGYDVTEVGIPFGSYDRRVLQSVLNQGYRSAFSSDRGLAYGPPLFSRNTVTAGHTTSSLLPLIRRETTLRQRMWRSVVRNAKSYMD